MILLGESLGGGVAGSLAAKLSPRALILERTFTSLPDVARHHFPFLPAHWLMRNRLDSLSKIDQVSAPVFQLHGHNDEVIPFPLAQKLADRTREPKEFLALPSLLHNDRLPDDYFQRLEAFLGRHGI